MILGDFRDGELLRHFGDVMAELRRRGLVRSANNPIADLAESLVAGYYEGSIADSPSQKSYDVLAANGDRLQVKALRLTRKGRSSLSAIRSHDFHALVAVVFELDLTPREAFRIPLDAVEAFQGWSATWQAHRLSLTKALCADARVERIDGKDLLAAAEHARSRHSAPAT